MNYLAQAAAAEAMVRAEQHRGMDYFNIWVTEPDGTAVDLTGMEVAGIVGNCITLKRKGAADADKRTGGRDTTGDGDTEGRRNTNQGSSEAGDYLGSGVLQSSRYVVPTPGVTVRSGSFRAESSAGSAGGRIYFDPECYGVLDWTHAEKLMREMLKKHAHTVRKELG